MGRVAGGLVKWLLVPAGFALLGYCFVGPRLAGSRSAKEIQRLLPLGTPKEVSAPPKEAPPSSEDAPNAPKVTVGVHPLNDEPSPSTSPPTTRHRRRHRTTETPPPSDAPDPASTPGP